MTGVQVTGLKESIRGFKKAGGDVEDLKDAFQAIGMKVVRTAQAEAPMRTGALRAGIKASRRQNSSIISSGGTSYHAYQHFGTKYVRPNPYLFEAVEREAEWVTDQVNKEIQQILRSAF